MNNIKKAPDKTQYPVQLTGGHDVKRKERRGNPALFITFIHVV